jgi:hypothetical protein
MPRVLHVLIPAQRLQRLAISVRRNEVSADPILDVLVSPHFRPPAYAILRECKPLFIQTLYAHARPKPVILF